MDLQYGAWRKAKALENQETLAALESANRCWRRAERQWAEETFRVHPGSSVTVWTAANGVTQVTSLAEFDVVMGTSPRDNYMSAFDRCFFEG